MNELIALCFDEQDRADKILFAINKIEEDLVAPEDTAVVVRDDNGRVQVKLVVDLTSASLLHGSTWGGFWGLLFGTLLIRSLLGRIEGQIGGGGAATMAARLTESGIDDDFIRALGEALTPNTSALFMRVRQGKSDIILAATKLFGGTAIRCTLAQGAEAKLLFGTLNSS